jgi:serine/threonine-protein kinase
MPGQRYASAEALAEDLQRYLDGEPIRARSLTLVDHVVRALSHSQVEAPLSTMSTTVLLSAPLPFLAHLLVFLLFRRGPYYPAAEMAVTMGLLVVMLTLIFWGHRATLRLVGSFQRRHLWSVWTSHMIGLWLILMVSLRMAATDRPSDLLFVYPLWAILAGTTFFALASNAGLFYGIGLICFGVAIVMTLEPFWAPLEVGLLMTFNLTALGLFLRRVGGESRSRSVSAVPFPPAAPPTTIWPDRSG